MKKLMHLTTALSFILFLFSCSSSTADMNPSLPAPETEINPVGTLAVIKEGMLMPQSGTNTKGMIEIVSDEEENYFLRLGNDFLSDFHTGTVTVYLSTSNQLNLSASESFQLVGVVNDAGEHFFNLSKLPESKFSDGIIWCGAAGIPFGYGSFE
ncbi:hypothetical protein [Algoriphagus machipongonensis]|uniref:DM13 domain-containing protein n=1 Tax=Algoriphagus machipongonensis TaxID=388413 RepID=A3I006_9BACT|nr:hypothetical protein [Algoriphagus machipongonensis]EAZ80842.1 hypothetical protein ALPR1_07950 [Algoriphagus machipongonensis]